MGLEQELQQKTEELAVLQQNFDDYIESSKELELELETAMNEAQSKLEATEKRQLEAETRNKELYNNWTQLNKENNSIQTELEKLKEKVSNLEISRRRLENENEELTSQVRVVSATEEDLRHRLQNADEDVVYLKADIDELKSVKKELEDKLAKEREIAALASQSARAQTSLLTDFANSQERCAGLEFQLNEKMQLISSYEIKIDSLQLAISELEVDNETLHHEVLQLKDDMAKIQNEKVGSQDLELVINNLRSLLQEEQEKVAERDAQLEELITAAAELEQQAQSMPVLQQQLSQLTAERDALLDQDQQSRQSQLLDQQKMLCNLQQQLESKQQALNELRQQAVTDEQCFNEKHEHDVHALQAEINRLLSALEQEQEAVVELSNGRASLLMVIEENEDLVTSLEHKLEKAEESCRELTSKNEKDKQELIKAYMGQLESAEKVSTQLRADIEQLLASKVELQDQISAQRALAAQSEQSALDQNRLLSQISEAQAKCNQLETEISLKSELIADYETRMHALQAASQSLDLENKQFQQELQNMRAANNELTNRVVVIPSLEASVVSLTSQLQEAQQQITEHNVHLQELMESRAELEQQAQLMAELQQQFEQLSVKHSTLLNENQNMQQSYSSIQRQLEQAQADRDGLQQQLHALQQAHAAIQNQLNLVSSERDSLLGQDEDARQAHIAIQCQLDLLTSERDSSMRQCQQVQLSLQALQQQLELISTERDSAIRDGQEIQSTLSDVQHQLSLVTAERESLIEKSSASDVEHEALQERLNQLASQRDLLMAQNEESSSVCQNLQEQLLQITGDRDSLQLRFEESQAAQTTLKFQFDELTAERDTLQNQCQRFEHAQQTMEQQLQLMHDEKESILKQDQDLKSACLANREQLDELNRERDGLLRQFQESQQALQNSQQQLELVISERDALMKQDEDSRAAHASLQQQVILDLQAKLESKVIEINNLQQEQSTVVATLKEKIDELDLSMREKDSTISQITKTNQQLQSDAVERDQEVVALNGQLQSTIDALESAKLHFAAEKSAAESEYNEKLETLQLQLQSLQMQLTMCTRERDDESAKIIAQQMEDINLLREQLQLQTAKKDQQQDEIAALEASISAFGAAIELKQQQQNEFATQLSNQLEQVTLELNMAREQEKAKDDLLAAVREEFTAKEIQLLAEQQRLMTLQSQRGESAREEFDELQLKTHHLEQDLLNERQARAQQQVDAQQQFQEKEAALQKELSDERASSESKYQALLLEYQEAQLTQQRLEAELELRARQGDFHLDNTTSNLAKLQQIVSSNDEDAIKKSLVQLTEQCEMLRTNNIALMNKVQAIRGNILVCCRTRPPNDHELAANGCVIVDATDDTEFLCYDGRSEIWKSFVFDRVWKEDATQADVFADVEPFALAVTEGFNACIMAYGQTGSGKTFTMDGYNGHYGANYRTIEKIFELLEAKKWKALQQVQRRRSSALETRQSRPNSFKKSVSMAIGKDPKKISVPNPSNANSDDEGQDSPGGGRKISYKVELSMLEIYNEQVYDLLADNSSGGQSGEGISLEIRQTPDNVVMVQGLKQVSVQNMREVLSVFSKGKANRATAATNLNEHSSRSHLIIQVDVSVEIDGESDVHGKLFLVDLAGSERVGKSGATGATMKEAQYINRSLLALGDVMEALDQKQKHIPYRNSKLTFLLQNALGGNARTMMVVTVCPTDLTFDETLFTLQFATRVRNISSGPAQRNSNSKNLEISVKNLKGELKEMKRKRDTLEETVSELRREQKRVQERSAAPLEARVKLLEESKKAAEIVVQQQLRQLSDTTTKLHEEREQKDHFRNELDVTQRNLRKALDQTKEQALENERYNALLKNKERELESMKLALQKHMRAGKGSPVQVKMIESDVPTPYHATKRSRFDDENNDAVDEHNPVEALMGPPPGKTITQVANGAPDSARRATNSRIPQRLSTSSNSSTSSATKSTVRVSMDSINPSFLGNTVSSNLRASTGGRGLSSMSNSSRSGITSQALQQQQQQYSTARAVPSTPTSNRLESSTQQTPTASDDFAQRVIRSAASSTGILSPNASSMAHSSASMGSTNSAAYSSRIPIVNARSEEALKRHQLRMEKKRTENPK